MMIFEGRNIYPMDLEASVMNAHPAIRQGCVAAFSVAGVSLAAFPLSEPLWPFRPLKPEGERLSVAYHPEPLKITGAG
jgi:hypothetical protein